MNEVVKISYNWESLFDPVGRICMSGDRIFRAISSGYEDRVRAFLSSDLFLELRNRNWIVDTWIANDIKIDNCNLVLEHEKVTCITPDVWTFNQWVDAAKFYIKIHDFCTSNKGTVNDARPSNIVFKNGKPLFIDFGSLIKLDEGIRLNWSRDFYISFLQTIAYLSDREYFHASAWANNAYCYYIDQQITPSTHLEDSLDYHRTYRHVVKSYDICIRQQYTHIRVRLYPTLMLLKLCNKIARKILNKKIDWNLFKIKALYKAPSISHFERICLPYTKSDVRNTYKVHDLSIFNVLDTIQSIFHFNRIMVYGNLGISDIISLAELTMAEILAVSPDLVYTDTLYLDLREHNYNIHVICANLRLELRQNVLRDITSNIVYIPETNLSSFRTPLELCAAVQKVSSRVLMSSDLYEQLDFSNIGFDAIWKSDKYIILEKSKAL